MHAATGAPLLLLGWVSVLVVGSRLLGGTSSPLDWLPGAGPLVAWWGLMALGLAAHLGARIRLRGALEDPATEADADGRSLRMGAGALSLLAGVAALFLVAGVVFGGRSAPEVYAVLDQALSGSVGVAMACLLGAAGGLYLSEELPRASVRVGLVRTERARRATQVISLLIGSILFAASMNLVSHFSVGRALLGAAAGGAP
jgi:hypothetical protein